MKKYHVAEKILLVLIGITLLVIWGHSVVPQTESAEESAMIVEVIQQAFDEINLRVVITDYLVRKSAHFLEHAALGAELLMFFTVYSAGKRQSFFREVMSRAWLLGFFAGFLDETIQLFSGRGSMVQDVWLDFSGVVFGSVLTAGVLYILRRIHERGTVRSTKHSQNNFFSIN